MNLIATRPLTTRDPETQGFTPTEISRLKQLKSHYDRFRESCTSNCEYERLCFLKWRYEQGKIEETVA